jgi:hypothetical protein
MKNLLILISLLLLSSLLTSCEKNGQGTETEWTYVTNDVNGNTFYYDKDRVRKSGKYLFFWYLTDFVKPVGGEFLSVTRNTQLDCSVFRFKNLKLQMYKNSMGEGEIKSEGREHGEWKYPKPDTLFENLYNKVCEEHQ